MSLNSNNPEASKRSLQDFLYLGVKKRLFIKLVWMESRAPLRIVEKGVVDCNQSFFLNRLVDPQSVLAVQHNRVFNCAFDILILLNPFKSHL